MKNTNLSARILAILLVAVMLAGILPLSSFAATTANDLVYLSVSFDGKYMTDKSGNYMAYVPVSLSELAAIDLNDYGLSDYVYDSTGGQGQDITVLHLFVYSHVNWYGQDWLGSVSVSGGPGSCFFESGLWGFDMNMTYNVNGLYPLYDDGWTGATADRVVLQAGDYVDLSGYTSWAFYSESNAGFRYFMNTADAITHSYTTTMGTATTVEVNRHKQEWGATLVQSYVADANVTVYYSKTLYDAEAPSVTTDAEGKAQITFPETGTYYLWSPGQYGADYETESIVSAPAYATVSVAWADPQTTSSYWPYFRGDADNMAITDVATPKDADSTVLKWATKLGSGWSAAPSVQIIADNALIVMSGTNLYKLDLQTGETLLTGTMTTSPSYGYTPPIYADGLIICPLGTGTLQAFDAETLKSVWVYKDTLGGQALSPITYSNGKVYTGFWNSETKDANLVCVSTSDGSLVWSKTVAGGFYWAGGVVVGDALIVGTDDGASGSTGDSHLFALNKETGTMISNLTLTGCGDQRSSMAYSIEKGRVYFTTKNGYIGSAAVNAATGELTDLKTVKHSGAQSTSTPVVYGDKLYFCCGSGVVASSNGAGYFVVADANTLEMLYAVEMLGYPQASTLLSTAYYQSEGKLYFYNTYNGKPGGLTLIKVDPTKNDATGYEKVEIYDAKGYEQYCIASPICGPDGTIYYKNDSGYVLAVTTNNAYMTGLSGDTGYQFGEFAASSSEIEWVVPIGTQSVTLTPTVSQGSAYTINELTVTSAPIPLTDGTGSATVQVTNGSDTRTYTISVREISDDATLGTLKINESNAYSGAAKTLSPTFAGNTYYYGVYDVGSSRSYENVWSDANDANATVKVYAIENILEGKFDAETKEIAITATNSNHNRYAAYFADATKPMAIRIVVTAENGDTAEYVVVMSKATAATEGAALLAQIESDDLAAAANKAAAAAVQEMIDAIGTVTMESKADIEAARTAYDALTDTQKDLVTNLETLTAAESKLAELKQEAADQAAAEAVESKISAIGTVTSDSKNAITAARTAYNALTDTQKALVSNLEVLTAAETAYAKLNTGSNPSTGDQTPIALLFILLIASMAGLTAIVICKKKHL